MPITDPHYIEQYKIMHSNTIYGTAGETHLETILLACAESKPKSILDYGAGRGKLYAHFKRLKPLVTYTRYDPAVPEISSIPEGSFDLVINTDVMEHIPTPDVDDVLSHIESLGSHAFFSISNRKAHKVLPSNENAHCTVQTPEWWLEKIRQFFPSSNLTYIKEDDYCIIVTWQPFSSSLYHLLETKNLGLPRQRPSLWQRIKKKIRG